MDPDIDVDALAVPARAEQEDFRLRDDLVLPISPPDEWGFGHMLNDVAKKISDEELEEIKELFRGKGGIGKKVREKCKTCTTFFGVLRENEYLSPVNLLYLFKILNTLQRNDLLEIAIRYCRRRGNVLHYFESTEEPEDGDEMIKIHIEGRDFNNYPPESLERLRQTVAMIVCAPPEDIRIAGIEPGSSLLVVFFIPEMYVTALYKLLKKGENLCELREIGVDIINLRNEIFNVEGFQVDTMSETEQQRKLKNVYEQLFEKSKALEHSNLQSIQKTEEVEQLRTTEKQLLQKVRCLAAELEQTTETMKQLDYKRSNLETTLESLQRMHYIPCNGRVAITNLQKALDDQEHAGTSTVFIRKILRYNTELVSSIWQLKISNVLKRSEMALTETKAQFLALRNHIFSGQVTTEIVLFSHYRRCLLGRILTINKNTVDIMRDITKALTDKERESLMARYYFEEYDIIKLCIEADKDLLLVALECKETEVTQTHIQTEIFMTCLLHDIGRHDLIKTMQEKMRKRQVLPIHVHREAQVMDGIDPTNIIVSLAVLLIETISRHLQAKRCETALPIEIDASTTVHQIGDNMQCQVI